jgi:hypothetical protein
MSSLTFYSFTVRFCQHDSEPSDVITQLLLIRCQNLSTRLRTFRCHHSTFTHWLSDFFNTAPDLQMSSLNFYSFHHFLTIFQKGTTNQHNHVSNHFPQTRNDIFNRQWKSAFGASPEVYCLLWNKINEYKTMPTGIDPKHLLWVLYFLKVYDTEHNSAHSLGKVDETTYQKWSELFVDAISYLECKVVRF